MSGTSELEGLAERLVPYEIRLAIRGLSDETNRRILALLNERDMSPQELQRATSNILDEFSLREILNDLTNCLLIEHMIATNNSSVSDYTEECYRLTLFGKRVIASLKYALYGGTK